MNKNSKGFTLIELLVVIAIIGILAALVLVALGNARVKAQDAAIQSDVGQLRTLAEVFFDANNASYDNGTVAWDTCVTTPTLANCVEQSIADSVIALKADAILKSSGTAVTVGASATAFCMSIPHATAGNNFCVESSGAFTKGTEACDTTALKCQ